jgi:prophage maintenance system killer protein
MPASSFCQGFAPAGGALRGRSLRTLLRLAEGIEGDPAVRDYSALVAAVERHRAELLGQPVHPDPVSAAAALLHAIVRLGPLETRNGILAWLVAYAHLGLNDITVKASPQEAVEVVRAAEAGALDEAAIAARLTAMIGADG